TGLNYFKETMKWIFGKKCFGFDNTKAENLSDYIIQLIKNSKGNYSFWSEIYKRYESELLSTLLMNVTIELANFSRMRYLSGLVPLIDYNTKTSHNAAFNVNMANVSVVEDRKEHGFQTPKYFYTICLNQNMIQRIDFVPLEKVIIDTKRAFKEPIFDGIFISVRGLPTISNEDSRVQVLSKFISEINKISEEESVPTWYSHFGLIGLNILDTGGSFASYHLNLYNIDDTYSSFGSNGKDQTKPPKHGRVFNKTDGRFYDANQLKKMNGEKRKLYQYTDFP